MSIDSNQPVDRQPFAPVAPETGSVPIQQVASTAPALKIPRRTSSAAWLNVILVLATIVAVGGVAFAVGRNTAPVAAAGRGNFGNGNFPRASLAPGQTAAPGGGQGGRFGGGAGFNLAGTVQSVTADTLTITTANGQTLEFTLGAGTTYDSKTPATASAVKTGSKVEVQLDFGAAGRPNAGASPSGPIGTATTVTVVP